MKVKVTEAGLFLREGEAGNEVEAEVGAVLNLGDEIPSFMVGKVSAIPDDAEMVVAAESAPADKGADTSKTTDKKA